MKVSHTLPGKGKPKERREVNSFLGIFLILKKKVSISDVSMPSPRRQTSRALHRALFSCGTQFLYRPNPRTRIYAHCPHIPSTPKIMIPTIRPKLFLQTFISCRCTRIWKSSRFLLTPKTNLLMIFTSRIDSVIHVLSSKTLTIEEQNF